MANPDKQCRDCSYCTEPPLVRLVKAPGRLLIAPFRAISWSLQRKCRKCGHPILDHHTDDWGRFQD